MDTLVVMGRLPQSARGAGSRPLQLLRVLRLAGCRCHVVALHDPAASQTHLSDLREACHELHVVEPDRVATTWFDALFNPSTEPTSLSSAGGTAKVAELMPRCKLVVCCDASMHPLVSAQLPPRLVHGSPNLNRPFYLMDMQDLRSRRLLVDSQSCFGLRRWALRADAAKVRQLEVEAARNANLALVSSHVDLQTLADRAPTATLWEIANGVELDQALSSIGMEEMDDAVMCLADPSVPHHARAAVWLARTVMPIVCRVRSEAKLHISGSALPWSVRRLRRLPWVELNDTSERDAEPMSVKLARCVVGVAAQRDARGVSELVLNMMAAGRPVVTTMTVAMSLPGESAAGPTPADRAGPIAESILAMLRDRKQAARHGQRCREFVASAATWDVQWRRVGALIQRLRDDQQIQVHSDSAGKRPTRAKVESRPSV